MLSKQNGKYLKPEGAPPGGPPGGGPRGGPGLGKRYLMNDSRSNRIT